MTAALIFASRPSPLARWQTEWVIQALRRVWPDLDCKIELITTQGDRSLDRPLPEIGGKGLFTHELETALLGERVHAAVHSLKDLPIESTEGLTIGAIPFREDPRDVLVSRRGIRLDRLPEGTTVGTSSLRRTAQLLAHRPDLNVTPLRGNVDTRIRKLHEGQYDAILLAAAGVLRLGLNGHITEWLPEEIMLPAPGQGALAVQCRSDDEQTLHYLSALEDPPTRQATTAERAFLTALGGGCSLPVGALAVPNGEGLDLRGVVAAADGSHLIRVQRSGGQPELLGLQLAKAALEQGAEEVLIG